MAWRPAVSQSESELSHPEDEKSVYYPQSGLPDYQDEHHIHYMQSDTPGLEHTSSVHYSQSGIHGLGHVEPVHYLEQGLPGLEHQVSTHNRSRGADLSGHWKASAEPAEGQEGVTPYLHEQNFEKAEIVLDENNETADTELIFNSLQEAYEWRSRTRTVNPQTSADPTIPRTLAQTKAAVKLVFKAYKSVAIATDNAGMLKAFQEQKHDNRHVETICWCIVEGCIDRCDRGPLLNAYEPEKAKNTANIKSFAERLDAIVESLSQQKTICKHLLDAPYLNRFLDDPVGSRQRVESNRKLNKKKGGVMNVGKKALGMRGKKGRPGGKRASEAVSDDETEENASEYKGESSDFSSPFRTPDQPIVRRSDSSGPPPIGFKSPYDASRFRSETPTPASRRRRAVTSTAFSPIKTRSTQSPFGERYSTLQGITPTRGRGYHSASLSMLPSSMVDPELPPYSANQSYNLIQTSGLMDPFQNTNQSPYAERLNSTYYNPYANAVFTTTAPTSAPFQASEQSAEPETNGSPTIKSDRSSSDGLGSDEEYLPSSARKRRRHQY